MKKKVITTERSQIVPMSTSNNQRSTVLNPTSSAFKAANDNRSRQLNPKDSVYHSSRRSGRKK